MLRQWICICALYSVIFPSSLSGEEKLSESLPKNEVLYLHSVSPIILFTSEKDRVIRGTGIVTANRIEHIEIGFGIRIRWTSYILTARHLFEDEKGISQEGTIRVLRAKQFKKEEMEYDEIPGKIVRRSAGYDLTLISVSNNGAPFFSRPVSFLTGPLPENAAVYIWATSGGGLDHWLAEGNYVRGSQRHTYENGNSKVEFFTSMNTTCKTRAGASGGGFFMKDGGLMWCVGTVTHTNAKTSVTLGRSVSDIEDFARLEDLGYAFTFYRPVVTLSTK